MLLAADTRRDYMLTNTRGLFGPSMSEFVFAYALMLERQVLHKMAAQRAHRWDGAWTGSLRHKRLGLLGVGSVGAHVAATAKHFGMEVHGFTRASERCEHIDAYYHGAEQLAAFCHDLDYLVCTLPATPQTRGLVDAQLLAALPARCVLMSVGRGAVVEEAALVAALREGRLAAAVLDVCEVEPLPSQHVLWETPNVYLTAHTAAPSYPLAVWELLRDKLVRFLAHEPLSHVVDFDRGY